MLLNIIRQQKRWTICVHLPGGKFFQTSLRLLCRLTHAIHKIEWIMKLTCTKMTRCSCRQTCSSHLSCYSGFRRLTTAASTSILSGYSPDTTHESGTLTNCRITIIDTFTILSNTQKIFYLDLSGFIRILSVQNWSCYYIVGNLQPELMYMVWGICENFPIQFVNCECYETMQKRKNWFFTTYDLR
jgi:hypothetical protein